MAASSGFKAYTLEDMVAFAAGRAVFSHQVAAAGGLALALSAAGSIEAALADAPSLSPAVVGDLRALRLKAEAFAARLALIEAAAVPLQWPIAAIEELAA